LREKWRTPRASFELAEILDDLAGFVALTIPETAEAYRRFWRDLPAPLGVQTA
jgi:hypothetical protein